MYKKIPKISSESPVAQGVIDLAWGRLSAGLAEIVGITLPNAAGEALRMGDITKYVWTIVNPDEGFLEVLKNRSLFKEVGCGFFEAYFFPTAGGDGTLDMCFSYARDFGGDATITIEVVCDRRSAAGAAGAPDLTKLVRSIFQSVESGNGRLCGSGDICHES